MVHPQDQALPQSQPIKSFHDLLAWQPGSDEYNVSSTPLHQRPLTLAREGQPVDAVDPSIVAPNPRQTGLRDCKVIVCHDMAGGYTEDVSPQGNDYNTIYSIQYWSYVDTFIYFSHHRITIPPPVWTNAAHRNGVRSIGTIITEWLPGILETDEMVSGPDQHLTDADGKDIVDRRWFSKTYADKLVDLAVYYKFDGWFINIESILRGGAQQVDQTIAFLTYLREQIHSRIPGGELIWYDSVISSTGEVAWQDKLSLENYRFFEQTDGIFTNYTWKEHYVGESVVLAGPRNRDVYTGVDIWGRNTFGGGGYFTYKALEVIQREGTSCALFATAWTYESLGKELFMTHDRLFWIGLEGAGIHEESLPLSSFRAANRLLLEGKLAAGNDEKADVKSNSTFLPVSAYIPARPSGCSSWFYSNFDRGFGSGFWVNGKKVSDRPWSHLSHQGLSPSLTKEVLVVGRTNTFASLPTSETVRWVISPKEAYNGGTSIVIQEFAVKTSTLPLPPLPTLVSPLGPSDPSHANIQSPGGMKGAAPAARSKSILVPLFDIQISLFDAQSSVIELVFKPCNDDVQVGIHLGVLACTGQIGHASNTSGIARQVTEQEFWKLLHPDIKAQRRAVQSRQELDPIRESERGHGQIHPSAADVHASDIEGKGAGRLAVVTLENVDMPESLGIGFALERSLQEANGDLYSTEDLEGGWKRLRIHLSRVFGSTARDQPKETSRTGSVEVLLPDLPNIFLSQLGVTLDYDSQRRASPSAEVTSDAATGDNESRPLAVLGSLALLPNWGIDYKGSCILGMKTEENQVSTVEKMQSALFEHQETQLDVGAAVNNQQPALAEGSSWLKVSSTVSWNVGFALTGPNLKTSDPLCSSTSSSSSSSSSTGHITSVEYSHFCIYLSLLPRGGIRSGSGLTRDDRNRNSLDDKEGERGRGEKEGSAMKFVGTAFVNRFRISNFVMPLDQDARSGEHAAEILDQSGQELWVWVQGVRRDGRADERRNWGKSQLM